MEIEFKFTALHNQLNGSVVKNCYALHQFQTNSATRSYILFYGFILLTILF
jgi:hypothetical protein